MRVFYRLFSVLFCFSLLIALPADAQEKKVKVFNDAKVKEMEELSTPTDMHAKLAQLSGEWSYTVTLWATQDAEPDVSEGRVMNEMIYGERFLTSKASAMMSLGNTYTPYEGQGVLGYDNDQKIFTSVWIDTLSTGMQTGTGTYNAETSTIEMTGYYMTPDKQKKASFRAELQFTDADTYTYTQYTSGKGKKEFKTMEVVYTRG